MRGFSLKKAGMLRAAGKDIIMKKFSKLMFLLVMVTVLTGCSLFGSSKSEGAVVTTGATKVENTGKKPIVIYFAYSENIGDTSNMSVDAVTSASLHESTKNTEGNMQVLAQEIAKRTGADVFHIVVKEPYNPKFEIMRDRVVKELDTKATVPLKEKAPDLSQYSTVYFGTPVWHYTMPPAVSTFLKETDLSGKTVVPFGINRGSRLDAVLNPLKELQPKIKLADGFTVEARTANEETRKQVNAFLDKLLGK